MSTPEGAHRRRRAPATGGGGGRRGRPPFASPNPTAHRRTPTPLRRVKPRKPVKVLTRSASEPILWTARLHPETTDGDASSRGMGDRSHSEIGQPVCLPRPYTCSDVFSSSPFLQSPSPSSQHPSEEMKVVVSVTVEGSPGPVRAMVRLGASVEEAISVVVDKYGREGRSPKLDLEAAACFQLHHSHFSLQSLNKSDKIGEVGSRSFYLRKSSSNNSFSFGREGSDMTTGGSETGLLNGSSAAVPPDHFFLSFIVKWLNKIGRRTRKLWRMVACVACG
ncbi:uncharacterized protein At4g22758 [Phoenix dactylifera]|uniref:Uncharacterized protein At4g22758 n=1 Tax=Phoenix dactylifera TaxID=42345 RepID=A0A8B7CGI1_PHODC|nr:uncharacterized protein At4g22758 [Phoenix dactylifera]